MTSNSFNIRLFGMAVLLATVSAIGGVSLWKITQARNQVTLSSLIVLPDPRIVADFRLTDHHSQPFTLADLHGKWSLIFFGFTNCPSVCPTALFELQKVSENMQQTLEAKTDKLQTLFISVDPERDTPARLEEYLSHFDPGFIGMTGDHAQLLSLTRQLGIAYRIEGLDPAQHDPAQHDPAQHDPGARQYDVAHSSSILLTDPQGRLYGVFPAPHDAEKISADLLAIIED